MLLPVLPLKLVQFGLVLRLVIFADPAVCFALGTGEEIRLVFHRTLSDVLFSYCYLRMETPVALLDILDNLAFGCHIHLDELGTPCHIVVQVILEVGSVLGWSRHVRLLQVITNSTIGLPSR